MMNTATNTAATAAAALPKVPVDYSKSYNHGTVKGTLKMNPLIKKNDDGSTSILFEISEGRVPVRIWIDKKYNVDAALLNLQAGDAVMVSGRFQHDSFKTGNKLDSGADEYGNEYYLRATSNTVKVLAKAGTFAEGDITAYNNFELMGTLKLDPIRRTNADGSSSIKMEIAEGRVPVRIWIDKRYAVPQSLLNAKAGDTVFLNGRFQHDSYVRGENPDGTKIFGNDFYVKPWANTVNLISAVPVVEPIQQIQEIPFDEEATVNEFAALGEELDLSADVSAGYPAYTGSETGLDIATGDLPF